MQSNRSSLATLFAIVGTAAAGPGPVSPYAINWHTIDGGGAFTSTAGDYALSGTIGQPDADAMTDGAYSINGGFWTAPLPCDGDTDGNGTVDVDDLVNVILDWETDGAANGGDVDGSGFVDVDDLVLVILNFGPCR